MTGGGEKVLPSQDLEGGFSLKVLPEEGKNFHDSHGARRWMKELTSPR